MAVLAVGRSGTNSPVPPAAVKAAKNLRASGGAKKWSFSE